MKGGSGQKGQPQKQHDVVSGVFYLTASDAVDITSSMSYIYFLTPPGRVTAKRFGAFEQNRLLDKPNVKVVEHKRFGVFLPVPQSLEKLIWAN